MITQSDGPARLRGCRSSRRRAACEHVARADLGRAIRVRATALPCRQDRPGGAVRLDRRPVTNAMFAQFVRQHPRWQRDQVASCSRTRGICSTGGHPLRWMLPMKISRSPLSVGLQPRRIAKRRGLGCRDGMSGSLRPRPARRARMRVMTQHGGSRFLTGTRSQQAAVCLRSASDLRIYMAFRTCTGWFGSG